MAITAHPLVLPATHLKLGRVSNLPTVWTNVLAGTVLGAGDAGGARTVFVALAMSMFYIGGMYLNDYCDRHVDARERPERPIPRGEISQTTVAIIAYALLFAGTALMASFGVAAAAASLALATAIVAYDWFHKRNPVAPLVMGLCRGLVYCAAGAAAVGNFSGMPAIAAVALVAYTAGLTYAARQESLGSVGKLWPLLLLATPALVTWPAAQHGIVGMAFYLGVIANAGVALYLLARRPVPKSVPYAVGLLIAGLSLIDASFLASVGAITASVAAAGGFAATLVLQRYVAGT
jgi:4-hydroxybenzoate polyprenyltransferase